LLWSDAVYGADQPAKYMIRTMKAVGFFECHDVEGLSYDSHQFAVTAWVAIQRRYLLIGGYEGERFRTVPDATMQSGEG
jgi:hypothetical protein